MRAEQNETVKKRMEELAVEKKRLGAELVTIDGHIELLGEYVRACCSAMEEQINRHFRSIRWKLFDTAKNGSVQDLCTATVNGVPYGGGLNTGASINAGIEIIRALSGVYDISAPCFVDNAEAVNALARTDGQMIELRVSADEPSHHDHLHRRLKRRRKQWQHNPGKRPPSHGARLRPASAFLWQ